MTKIEDAGAAGKIHRCNSTDATTFTAEMPGMASDRAISVSILKRPGAKRVRRILGLAVVLAPAV